jgi:hypothetical protein
VSYQVSRNIWMIFSPMTQIFAWSNNIVCINTNVQCKMIMVVYTIWQVPHPVVSVPSDRFMVCNKLMNECSCSRNASIATSC